MGKVVVTEYVSLDGVIEAPGGTEDYMNIMSMGAIIPKLAETHMVCALELQGHGRTTTSTAHTAVITQPELSHALIEPFRKGETPKSMFDSR